MSPIDAALREITIELDALAQRIGNGSMPTRVSVEIEFDPKGNVRAVELHPVWRRHVLGGGVATRNNGIRPNDLRSVDPLTR